MNPILTKTLQDLTPESFLFASKPIPIEVDDGWFAILYKIVFVIKYKYLAMYPNAQIHIAQIKEKFGGLRFYCDYENVPDKAVNEIETIIAEAEMLSFNICEKCGLHDKTVKPSKVFSYVKTLCKECKTTK